MARANPARPESGSRKDRIATLRAVALFGDLLSDEGALSALAALMEERRYGPGSPILKEGDTGQEMYVLVSGDAAVYKSTPDGEEYKVAILRAEAHAFFGEGGLLAADARSATIRAERECHCLMLSRSAFEQFGLEHPQWALPILRRIANAVMTRFRKANDDLMLLYNALVAEIRGG